MANFIMKELSRYQLQTANGQTIRLRSLSPCASYATMVGLKGKQNAVKHGSDGTENQIGQMTCADMNVYLAMYVSRGASFPTTRAETNQLSNNTLVARAEKRTIDRLVISITHSNNWLTVITSQYRSHHPHADPEITAWTPYARTHPRTHPRTHISRTMRVWWRYYL